MTLGKLLYEPTPDELADACALLRQARGAIDRLIERHGAKLACGGTRALAGVQRRLRDALTLDDTYDQATGE